MLSNVCVSITVATREARAAHAMHEQVGAAAVHQGYAHARLAYRCCLIYGWHQRLLPFTQAVFPWDYTPN